MHKSNAKVITLPAPARSPRQPWAWPQAGSLTAPILDRLADLELQHGHHGAAERLSARAAEMREAVR